jgi:HSP20 family protein
MANLIPWKRKQTNLEETEGIPLTAFRREMDRLFDTFFREPFGAMEWPWAGRGGEFLPAVDVVEEDDGVTVRAELPGIDPKDLDISITGNELTLKGEKRESAEKKGKGYSRSETRFGSFHRTVQLPEGVDTQQVDAQYANGVVTLKLKKDPAFATKKIQVQVKSWR